MNGKETNMELMIGEKIKKYRHERDMTQDQLAQTLGVSPQSISKWECADGYPDITLLPGIANFFEVTVDELIGNDEIGQEEDIKQFYDKSNEMDDTEEKVEYNLKYARKYPKKHIITYILCCSIMNLPDEKRTEYLPLLKESCEKIIAESTDQGLREDVITFMCQTCSDQEFDKWYGMYTSGYDSYKGEVLEMRLWEQKRYEEAPCW